MSGTLALVPSGPGIAELTEQIKAEHNAVRKSLGDAYAHAIRCGELLCRAKELCGHGGFGSYLRKHFPKSEKTAQNYMRLFREQASIAELKSATVADMGIRAAILAITTKKREPKRLALPVARSTVATPEVVSAEEEEEAMQMACDAMGVPVADARAAEQIKQDAPEVFEAMKRGEIDTVAEAQELAAASVAAKKAVVPIKAEVMPLLTEDEDDFDGCHECDDRQKYTVGTCTIDGERYCRKCALTDLGIFVGDNVSDDVMWGPAFLEGLPDSAITDALILAMSAAAIAAIKVVLAQHKEPAR